MALKRATQPYSVFLDGQAYVVTPGQVLDEGDDRYREVAGAFEDIGSYVQRTAKPETATAEPGEKRTRTTAKKTADKPKKD
jgi:hypothetical protein